MSNPSDPGVATFLVEAADLLEQVEAAALTLEERPGDQDVINELFRAFHTIKGSGAMVGYDALSKFTHHVETALARVRSGRMHIGPELVSLLLSAKDHIQLLLDAGPKGSPATDSDREQLIAELSAMFRHESAHAAIKPAPPLAADERDSHVAATDDWFVVVEPNGIRYEDAAGFAVAPPVSEGSGGSLALTGDVEPLCSTTSSSVCAPSARLDRLVKLVAELNVNQRRLVHAFERQGSQALCDVLDAMTQLCSELRDSVFGTRMMPVGSSFSRLQRLVQDLSAELGKPLDLITEGEDTELPDALLDLLITPLIQLVRNGVQHGIEPEAERLANGKPGRGILRLTATRRGSAVVITVEDDGRGMNAAAFRTRAEQKNLLGRGVRLSEQESLDLVFLPNFGRVRRVARGQLSGLGLDVVKSHVEAMGGVLELASRLGEGTTFRLQVPCRVPILDGALVEVAGAPLIIPGALVIDRLVLPREHGPAAAHRAKPVISVQGQLIPYVRLRDLLGLSESKDDFENVVIVDAAGARIGVVVDRVLGRLACGAGLIRSSGADAS